MKEPSKAARSTVHRTAPDQRLNVHYVPPGLLRDGGDRRQSVAERSIVDQPRPQSSFTTASSPTAPPPSPGLSMAETSYDVQHHQSSGYQTGRLAGADIVHFVYTERPIIPSDVNDYGRYTCNDAYSIAGGNFTQPFGCCLGLLDCTGRGGYIDLAVDAHNALHSTFQQRPDSFFPYTIWHAYYPTPGSSLHIDDELQSPPQSEAVFFPQIAMNRNSGWDAGSNPDVAHIIARSSGTDQVDRLIYWRYVSGSGWVGPVAIDSSAIGLTVGYVLAADPNSDKVAIVWHTDQEPQFNGLNNIVYYESQTEGAGWVSGNELGATYRHFVTNYNDPNGPQAWLHISAAYDNHSRLHIAWDEQERANATTQATIRHWQSARNTIRTVVQSRCQGPMNCDLAHLAGTFNLNLANVTMGIGDGATLCDGESNLDYVYVLYTQFGGPSAAEENDYSALGYYNGELYLAVSTTLGLTWSAPRNLTNTETPNCDPGPGDPAHSGAPPRPDSVCRSENWATIGQIVHDIDIIYISDLDAGGIVYDEGTWQMDPVKYLRLPGGTPDAPYLCPFRAPMLASFLTVPEKCGFHAPLAARDSAVLVLSNYGNDTLTGTVSVVYVDPVAPSVNWLSINGAQSLPISILPGGVDPTYRIVMDATGLASGSYQAAIDIRHNDASQSDSTVYPLAFIVAPCLCHADPACDGVTNVLDVVAEVDRAFRASAEMVDPTCPHGPPLMDGRTDIDCNGRSDIVDVVKMISVAFRGADRATMFCDPCAP